MCDNPYNNYLSTYIRAWMDMTFFVQLRKLRIKLRIHNLSGNKKMACDVDLQ